MAKGQSQHKCPEKEFPVPNAEGSCDHPLAWWLPTRVKDALTAQVVIAEGGLQGQQEKDI